MPLIPNFNLFILGKAIMLSQKTVDDMRQPIERAACLPGLAYCDQTFMADEVARIFNRNWISIGLGQQVPLPGNLRPVTVCGLPLLMVRDQDGNVRVFHNVCRHRGLQLAVGDRTEQAKAIVCPYHGWTYGLDGRCIAAPHWYRDEKKHLRPTVSDDYGLIELPTRVWLDTIFINLLGNAPPFEQVIAPLETMWNASAVDPLYRVPVWEGEIPANWKLVIENFLDAYHLPYVHPQAGSIDVHTQHKRLSLSKDIFGQQSIEAAVNKPKSGPIPSIPQLETALGNDDQTFCLFPNTLLFVQRSFLSVRAVVPLDAALTYVSNSVYVSEAAAHETFSPERELLKETLHLVNEQDMVVLGRLQATRRSPAVDRGRFAPQWDFLSYEFQLRVASALKG